MTYDTESDLEVKDTQSGDGEGMTCVAEKIAPSENR